MYTYMGKCEHTHKKNPESPVYVMRGYTSDPDLLLIQPLWALLLMTIPGWCVESHQEVSPPPMRRGANWRPAPKDLVTHITAVCYIKWLGWRKSTLLLVRDEEGSGPAEEVINTLVQHRTAGRQINNMVLNNCGLKRRTWVEGVSPPGWWAHI